MIVESGACLGIRACRSSPRGRPWRQSMGETRAVARAAPAGHRCALPAGAAAALVEPSPAHGLCGLEGGRGPGGAYGHPRRCHWIEGLREPPRSPRRRSSASIQHSGPSAAAASDRRKAVSVRRAQRAAWSTWVEWLPRCAIFAQQWRRRLRSCGRAAVVRLA